MELMLNRISNLGVRAKGVFCSFVVRSVCLPDNGNVNYNSSNANFPNVGGNYGNDAGNVGIFYCNVNNNSTNSNANYCARLAYLLKMCNLLSSCSTLSGWIVSEASSLDEILGRLIQIFLVPFERSEGKRDFDDTRSVRISAIE